jgi:Flp pilus assembly protein TadD
MVRFGVFLAVLLWAGCSQRQARVAAPQSPGRVSAMEVQIKNAVKAGDGDYEIAALQRALVGDPSNLALRRKLAARYEANGYPELAIDHLRIAASYHPHDTALCLELVKRLNEMKLPSEALKEAGRFTAAHGDTSPAVWSWQAILLDQAGRLADGEKAHRKAVALAAGEAYLHNNLGQNLLAQGRRQEAAAEFRRALELEPRNETARNNLGIAEAAAEAGQPSESLAQWQSVNDPASAHNNLAAVLIERKEYDRARLEISIALSYDRQHAAALRNLELVSRLDGKPAEVERIIVPGPPGFWDRVGRWFKNALGWAPAPKPAQTERAADAAASAVSYP